MAHRAADRNASRARPLVPLVRIAWAAPRGEPRRSRWPWSHDAPLDGMATLFGLALIAGWLLTFLLGILQRIVPFLASMHAARRRRRQEPPPTPSALTAERPLAIHFACHLAALALLALGVAADSAAAVRAAAAGRARPARCLRRVLRDRDAAHAPADGIGRPGTMPAA